MIRKLSMPRPTGTRAGAVEAAWTDLGDAVLLHSAAAGPDPAVIEYCVGLARFHGPTLVFVDLPAAAVIANRDDFATYLATRPGVPRFVPVRPQESAGFASAQFGEWLACQLGREVLAHEGRAVDAAGGRFVPVGSGAGWLRFAAGRVPTAYSRRFPTPAWERPVFAEVLDLGGGVRAEPLPAGVWITAPGPPQIADSYRKWLIGGLKMDPAHPRVVIGHPGLATPLAAVAAFWARLDDEIARVVRFAGFGPVESAAEPSGRALGYELADLLGAPVTVEPGVPVLAPSAAGGTRTRTLLPDGAMRWQPYVWGLRYLPRSADGAEPDAGPEPVGYRAPIEGLFEVAPAVYEYAPESVLEVTQSGLWMRPPGASPESAVVRGAPPEPDRTKLFYTAPIQVAPNAAGARPDAERMRRLAEEAAARLEPDLAEVCDVLPSTAALRPTVQAPEQSPWLPAAEITPEVAPVVPAVPGVGVAASTAAASVDETLILEALIEMIAAENAETETACVAESETVAQSESEAVTESVPEPESVPESASEPVTESVAEAVVEVEPVQEPAGQLEATAVSPPPTPASPPPIGRIRLESGPALDFPVVAAPLLPSPPEAPPSTPEPVVEPVAVVASSVPDIEPVPRPAPPTALRPRVQSVPSPESSAVLPSRALEQERQWLRRNLAEQYDATVGLVSRVLSESPGLRTGGAALADVLVDLVAVHLYLSGHTRRFDDLVRSGRVGPHVPLARCVASGLRRLPSHRGATLMRTTLREHELQWYGSRNLVTEWAFAPALTGARARLPGDVDVLIWSLTARRTDLLAPQLPDQVVFLPGTSFKVLSVATAAGDRARVLLRELAASEIAADGRVDPGRVPFDEVALRGLTEAGEKWSAQESADSLPESYADRFGASPGLIVQAAGAPGASSTGTGTGTGTVADTASTARAARDGHPAAAAGGRAAASHLEGRAS